MGVPEFPRANCSNTAALSHLLADRILLGYTLLMAEWSEPYFWSCSLTRRPSYVTAALHDLCFLNQSEDGTISLASKCNNLLKRARYVHTMNECHRDTGRKPSLVDVWTKVLAQFDADVGMLTKLDAKAFLRFHNNAPFDPLGFGVTFLLSLGDGGTVAARSEQAASSESGSAAAAAAGRPQEHGGRLPPRLRSCLCVARVRCGVCRCVCVCFCLVCSRLVSVVIETPYKSGANTK